MSDCAVYLAFGRLQDGKWTPAPGLSMSTPVQRFTPRSSDFLDRTTTIEAGVTRSIYNRVNTDAAADFHIIELLSDDPDDELEVWIMRDRTDASTGYATGTRKRWDMETLTNKLPFTIPGYQAFVHETYSTDSGGDSSLPNIGSSSTRVVGAFYKIVVVNNTAKDLRIRQVYQK